MTERLTRHLASWLGVWPPPSPGLTVVGSEKRTLPGWDGKVRPVRGVRTPEGTVLSVPPHRVDEVKRLGDDLEVVASRLAEAVGVPGWRFHVGVFRWCERPGPTDRPGVWVPTDHPDVPEWLKPFNGEVLLGYENGEVAAGVGRKIHDRWGHEIAVVTEPGHRRKGWARRLVAQAALRILDEGAVPTYLHPPDNLASARTADAAGFPDRGWRILGLFPDTRPG